MQEHYRLADRVSEDEDTLVFNNSIATNYTQVNLLHFCKQELKLLIFLL
jgi:hypothetical protein